MRSLIKLLISVILIYFIIVVGILSLSFVNRETNELPAHPISNSKQSPQYFKFMSSCMVGEVRFRECDRMWDNMRYESKPLPESIYK